MAKKQATPQQTPIAQAVQVLANGSVSIEKFSANQLKTIESTLATVASADYAHDKLNGPKWRPLVDLCVKRGIVIKALKSSLSKATMAAYVVAWTHGKGSELNAKEERLARKRGSDAVSQAFVHYGPAKSDPAASTSNGKTDTEKAKADTEKAKTEAGLSVGNSLPNVISVTADMENALRTATAARESLVGYQTAFIALKPPPVMIEQIATIALQVGTVQDLIGKVLKLITA